MPHLSVRQPVCRESSLHFYCQSLTYWSHQLLYKRIIYLVLRKSFRKTNIFHPLIRTLRMWAYQGVKNTCFAETFTYVLNKWPPKSCTYPKGKMSYSTEIQITTWKESPFLCSAVKNLSLDTNDKKFEP